jgi:hypothetical protein
MTTSDTTGDKVVESIRRTKTAAAPATEPAAAAPRRRVTRAATKADTSPQAPQPSEACDNYRSAGRVWPD